MANVTLYIPDSLKEKMDEHKEVRWSSAVRIVIERKLADFEEADRLAKKSNLTHADVNRISKKIDEAMGKKARALLNESRR